MARQTPEIVAGALDTSAEEMLSLEARMETLRAERAEMQRATEPQIDIVSCAVAEGESVSSALATSTISLGKRAAAFVAIADSLDSIVKGRAAHVSITRHTLVDVDVKERLSLAIDFR